MKPGSSCVFIFDATPACALPRPRPPPGRPGKYSTPHKLLGMPRRYSMRSGGHRRTGPGRLRQQARRDVVFSYDVRHHSQSPNAPTKPPLLSASIPLPKTHIRRTPSELQLADDVARAEYEDVRMYAPASSWGCNPGAGRRMMCRETRPPSSRPAKESHNANCPTPR
ncbi:hypothetical protein ACHAXT_004819 [Thalassiosira profunda]